MSFLSFMAGLAGTAIGQNRQARHNKDLANFQHQQNMELLKYQLDYNTPASQMGRFEDAGLNPNLIYGQGSPGNMESAPRYPDIKPTDMQSGMDFATRAAQLKLLESQTDLTNQRTVESGVKQDVMKAQRDLINANPYLNKSYVNALVTQLESAAAIKKQEADWLLTEVPAGKGADLDRSVPQTVGWIKMNQELQNLFQKYELNSADQAIKARVLQSKDFQNELQKIQVDWMKDGEITSQHIYMGLMLILSKLM